jgi:peptide/nickel transport system ATP-binding protein
VSPVLSLRDVGVAYGTGRSRRVAARNVSLSIEPGETLALVGESGSGKSTIGRVAIRLLSPFEGSVHWNGEDVTSASAHDLRVRRNRFQLVPQDPGSSFDPYRTVGWSVTLNIPDERVTAGATKRSIAEELVGSVGLPASALDGHPRQFSGGQRQRLAIARALASEPALMVCDEVTSGLDVSTQASVLELLRSVQRRSTVALLFITHDLAVVRQVADRVAVMSNGEVVEQGPVNEILDAPSSDYTQRLLASVPDLSRVRTRASGASSPGR